MQINILIDNALMAQAMKASGGKSEKEIIEEGLRLLIQLHAQKEIRKLRGKLTWRGVLEDSRNDASR